MGTMMSQLTFLFFIIKYNINISYITTKCIYIYIRITMLILLTKVFIQILRPIYLQDHHSCHIILI